MHTSTSSAQTIDVIKGAERAGARRKKRLGLALLVSVPIFAGLAWLGIALWPKSKPTALDSIAAIKAPASPGSNHALDLMRARDFDTLRKEIDAGKVTPEEAIKALMLRRQEVAKKYFDLNTDTEKTQYLDKVLDTLMSDQMGISGVGLSLSAKMNFATTRPSAEELDRLRRQFFDQSDAVMQTEFSEFRQAIENRAKERKITLPSFGFRPGAPGVGR